MKRILLLLFIISAFIFKGYAQQIDGYIILIEGNAVYIDKTSPEVKLNDRFDIHGDDEYIIHPITKQKIKKDSKVIGTLTITKLMDKYSIAQCTDTELLKHLKVGMRIYKKSTSEDQTKTKTISDNKSERIPIIITPTEVNDITGIGYFGIYVSDMLMEKILQNDKITLLDRSILETQMNEIDLAGEYIDASTAIKKGNIKGAKYAIQVTMQKPDVVNMRTGAPIASVMGAIQSATNFNLGAQYFSNTKVERLKAAVNITARVIDLQTGEVVFMCSGAGTAKGKVQLGLEYGALGGTQINGGIQGFKQTVTGQAIEQAFGYIANGLNKYFGGETTERVLSNSGIGNNNEKLRASRGRLYLETQKLSEEDIQSLFSNNSDLYFKYQQGRRLRKLSCIPTILGSVLAFAIPLAGLGEDGDVTGYIVAGGLSPIIGLAGTGWMIYKGNKEIKEVANIYNTSNKNRKWDLSLVPSHNGFGLRLSF